MGGWLPAVQALLEHVQGNPEIEERLASIAADMQNAGQELADARAGTAERYDIGDDGDQHWGGDHGQAADAQGNCLALERDGPKGAPGGWRPEGAGRLTKARCDAERGQPPTTGPHDHRGNDGDAPPPTATTAGAAGSADPTPGTAVVGNKRGAADPPTEAKGPVRQKTEAEAREEADRRRAAELLQQQQQAIAAQQASHDAGAGGFGSQTAQSVAAQHFVAQVCKAVDQARTMGIEPRAGGRELVELTPMELKQWVADHIGDEASWA